MNRKDYPKPDKEYKNTDEAYWAGFNLGLEIGNEEGYETGYDDGYDEGCMGGADAASGYPY